MNSMLRTHMPQQSIDLHRILSIVKIFYVMNSHLAESIDTFPHPLEVLEFFVCKVNQTHVSSKFQESAERLLEMVEEC